MRKKFKILYPQDYHEQDRRGTLYRPPANCRVMMNSAGVFFLYHGVDHYPWIQKLSDTLPKYDVVWL